MRTIVRGVGILLLLPSVAPYTALAQEGIQIARASPELMDELVKVWPKNRTVRLVFHGHSVPAGYFKTPEIRRFDSYPHLVQRGLCNRFPTAAIDVSVTAIGGENSSSGAKRFEKDVLAKNPDVVFIDYSLNDRRIGLEDAAKSWEQMIREAKKRGVFVVLLTPTPDTREDILDDESTLEQHRLQVLQLGRKHGVVVVDSYAAFRKQVQAGKPVEEFLSQVNHPNRKGHEIVAGLILRLFPEQTTDQD
ncbi:MAG: SGNH/GDSL hydrolase family protein [Aureliella sp.]